MQGVRARLAQLLSPSVVAVHRDHARLFASRSLELVQRLPALGPLVSQVAARVTSAARHRQELEELRQAVQVAEQELDRLRATPPPSEQQPPPAAAGGESPGADAELAAQLARLEAERSRLEDETERLADQRDDLTEKLQQLADELAARDRTIADFKAWAARHRQEVETYVERQLQLRRMLAEQAAEKEHLQRRLAALEPPAPAGEGTGEPGAGETATPVGGDDPAVSRS